MSTNNSPNEENKSTVADVVYDDNRTCSLCKQTFPRSSFSLNQWSKNEAAKCKGCLHAKRREENIRNVSTGGDDDGGSSIRTCSLCQLVFPREGFSSNQWSKNEAAKCKGCAVARMCACCNKYVSKQQYTKSQWSKGNAGKCKDCIDKRQLEDKEKTEAYQVRKDNSIHPKDRLIKFCELSCIMDLGELNGGGILPETVEVPKCQDCSGADEEKSSSMAYINTPYKYWGLPPDGTGGMKQNLMKRVMKQCSDFYDMDMKWFVANSTLVEPFFDEVASMHKDGLSPELRFTEGAGNWAQYIADVPERLYPLGIVLIISLKLRHTKFAKAVQFQPKTGCWSFVNSVASYNST